MLGPTYGELCLARLKSGETMMEDCSNSDTEIELLLLELGEVVGSARGTICKVQSCDFQSTLHR